MSDEVLQLPTPESFDAFPYNPSYSIQLDLMRHLFTALESRKVAILESPTGTVRTHKYITMLVPHSHI